MAVDDDLIQLRLVAARFQNIRRERTRRIVIAANAGATHAEIAKAAGIKPAEVARIVNGAK